MHCSMAGKSTILRMLFRFFDTDSGNVSIFLFVCELWGLVWKHCCNKSKPAAEKFIEEKAWCLDNIFFFRVG